MKRTDEKAKNASSSRFMTLRRATFAVLSFFHWLNGKKGWRSFLSGIICVAIGLLAGFLFMLFLDPGNALKGLWTLISEGFSDFASLNTVIYSATPMVLSGLAIAFAFKLGLFNIGITGQLTAGAFVGLLLGIAGFPWYFCLIVATLAGAAVGLVTGWLKAKFNVNEVLSGIMLNWIIFYLIGLIGDLYLPSSYKDKATSANLIKMPTSGRMPSLGISVLPGVSVGLIIAFVIVVVIQITLDKTKFGFELRLSGSNKFAAQYAGVNQTQKIILALTISGALAGLCGYMIFANPKTPLSFRWDSSNNSTLSNGFDGISVSLIAQNSPIGCIFSSILLACIDSAQTSLKGVSDIYNIHYTELIKSIIIYVASFSSFFNILIQKWHASHIEDKRFFTLAPRKEDFKDD